jgi:gliding motility-associated-like protein
MYYNKLFCKVNIACLLLFLNIGTLQAQLGIRIPISANELAQKLVGTGITVTNATLTTGTLTQTGIFSSTNTIIPYDSGIVLTTGRSRTNGTSSANTGLDGPATNDAEASLNGSGDAQLTSIISNITKDASVLEFDFVTLGDTVSFDYIFSSEEYPEFNCTEYNDVFAFFISGPGIVGSQNIALIPGTSTAVSINSINNGIDGDAGDAVSCSGVYTNLYLDNSTGLHLTHNGLTKSLKAKSAVQPCQVYHLKIAIADAVDGLNDSGVFLKAGSLNSNAVRMEFTGILDVTNNETFTAEGCSNGSLSFNLPTTRISPTTYQVITSGTAINGVDVNLIPSTITIPPNTLSIQIPIVALVDNIPEGTEVLKVYLTSPCNATNFLDSIYINIRDYDTLNIQPISPSYVCNSGIPTQLTALGSYTNFTWDANATLSATNIANPVATPTSFPSVYYCTAAIGNCRARDSITILKKEIVSQQFTNVNCKNGTTGSIKIVPGNSFSKPILFSLNGGPNQLDSNFNNLSVGNYIVTLTDNIGCIRTYNFNIIQAFPDLTFTETIVAPNCNGIGSITVTASGGNPSYTYSKDGLNYSTSNILPASAGNNTVYVKDANDCVTQKIVNVIPISTLNIDSIKTTNAVCSTSPTGTITVHASLGQAPYKYSIDGINFQTSNVFTVFEGIKLITIEDAIGCKDTMSVQVGLTNDLLVFAGNDTTYCEGKSVQLQGFSTGLTNLWSPTVNFNNASILNPVLTTNGNQIYILTATKGSCNKSDTINVSMYNAPIPNAGNDVTICYGQNTTLQGSGGVQYIWSPNTFLNNTNIQNPISTPTNDIKYALAVVSNEGCISLIQDTVTVTVTPPIIIKTNNDTLIAANQPLQITTVGAPFYNWIPANYLNNTNIAQPIAIIPTVGLYQYIVKGFTANGCIGFDTLNINVYKGPEIYVPTAFTPNNDNNNDVFFIKAVGLKHFDFVRVFNRWGQLVFESKDVNTTWNGKTKNGKVIPGAYVWMVSGTDYLNNQIFKKGTLVIIN